MYRQKNNSDFSWFTLTRPRVANFAHPVTPAKLNSQNPAIPHARSQLLTALMNISEAGSISSEELNRPRPILRVLFASS